jgi:hypothetical protein
MDSRSEFPMNVSANSLVDGGKHLKEAARVKPRKPFGFFGR